MRTRNASGSQYVVSPDRVAVLAADLKASFIVGCVGGADVDGEYHFGATPVLFLTRHWSS